MGCTQSKIDNEEAVSRCKERKRFMKDAVAARNAFASAHSACAITLKNTGAALSDYTHAEVPVPHHSSSMPAHTAPVTSSSVDPLPPPPPLPDFQTPIQRAASMPEMKIQKPESKSVRPTIMEEEEMEFDALDDKLIRKRSSSSKRGTGSNRGAVQENHQPQHHMEQSPQKPQPSQQQQWKDEVMRGPTVHQGSSWSDYIFPPMESMPGPTLAEPAEVEELGRREFEEKANKVPQEEEEDPVLVVEEKVEKAVEVPVPAPLPVVEKKAVKKGGGEMGRRVAKPMNLMGLFAELDDHFLKASESAHEVSKMLEATRLHYHSNFADNRGNFSLFLY